MKRLVWPAFLACVLLFLLTGSYKQGGYDGSPYNDDPGYQSTPEDGGGVPQGVWAFGGQVNGDTMSFNAQINLDNPEAVSLVGVVERAASWLSDVTATEIVAIGSAKETYATSWTPGERIYHGDKIVVRAVNAQDEVVDADSTYVVAARPPVEVEHDGYVSGFYSQTKLERTYRLLAPDMPAGTLEVKFLFEETGGLTAYDTGDDALEGTIFGATRVAGKYGRGLEFDGVNDYVRIDDHNTLDLDDLTITAWIKPYSRGNDPDRIEVLEKADTYWMNIRKDTGYLRVGGFFGPSEDPADYWRYQDSDVAIPLNEWTHVAYTYDGSTNKVYVNGVLAGSSSAPDARKTNTEPLAIGCKIVPVTGVKEAFFHGIIDEIYMFSTVLDADGIAGVMEQDAFHELATNYDVGIMGTSLLYDGVGVNAIEDGYRFIDRLRAINPDYIPIIYHYWSFYSPNWVDYPLATPQRQQYLLMENFPLLETDADTVISDWSSRRTNPTKIDTTGTRQNAIDNAYWTLTAKLLRDLWRASSAYRDQVGFMMDWMTAPNYPQGEGVTYTNLDFDEDTVAYPSDTSHAGFKWLIKSHPNYESGWKSDLTEAEAWVAACDSFKVAMKRYLPEAISLVNGQYADDHNLDDAIDTDGHLWEFVRKADSAGYARTWKLFTSFVQDYPSIWNWDGPFNLGFWDTRHEQTTYPELQGSNMRTEGPALISGGVAGWSLFDDNTLPASERLRTAAALDDTALAMNLGAPTAPAVFDSLFHCYRYYGDYKVSLRWNGDRRYPMGWGWKIVNTTTGAVVRNNGYDIVPSYKNADLLFAGYEDGNSNMPTGYAYTDFDLPVLNYDKSYNLRRGAPTTDFSANADIRLKTVRSDQWATGILTDANHGLVYLGLDLLSGADVSSAALRMRIAGTGGTIAADTDTIYVIGACGSGWNVWRDDLTFTSYDEPNPGESWPKDMDSFKIENIKGTNGAVSYITAADVTAGGTPGDWIEWDITEHAQAAADHPDQWGGLWLVWASDTGGKVLLLASCEKGLLSDALATVTTAPADKERPKAPGSLIAASGEDGQVPLLWSPSSDNVGLRVIDPYVIARSTTGGGPYTAIDSTDATSYVDTTVVNGTLYYYVARAVDTSGNVSFNSNQASAVPSAGGEDTTPPEIPVLDDVTAGDGQLVISWLPIPDAAGDFSHYNVYGGTDAAEINPDSLLTLTGTTGTWYNKTGLANGTEYHFEVTAVDDSDNESDPLVASGTPTQTTLAFSQFNLGQTSATGDNVQVAAAIILNDEAHLKPQWHAGNETEFLGTGWLNEPKATDWIRYYDSLQPFPTGYYDDGVIDITWTNGTGWDRHQIDVSFDYGDTWYLVALDASSAGDGLADSYTHSESNGITAPQKGPLTYRIRGVKDTPTVSYSNSIIYPTYYNQYTVVYMRAQASRDSSSGIVTSSADSVSYVSVPVVPDPPVAAFSGTPVNSTLNKGVMSVTFTDASTNTPTSWAWTFGDGGTSTSKSPAYEYKSDGVYTVSLTATNAGGSDDEVKTDYITVGADVTAPDAPTGLVASDNQFGKVILDWDDNTEADLSTYNVYKGPTGSTVKFKEGITASTWIDGTAVNDSAAAYYQITAVDKDNNESTKSTADDGMATAVDDTIGYGTIATYDKRDLADNIQNYAARIVMTEAGDVTKGTVYLSSTDPAYDIMVSLYNASGTLLVSGTASVGGTGWHEVTFSSAHSAADEEVLYAMCSVDEATASSPVYIWFDIEDISPTVSAWHISHAYANMPEASASGIYEYTDRRFSVYITFE